MMDVNLYESPKVNGPPKRLPFMLPLAVDYAAITLFLAAALIWLILSVVGH